MTTDPFGESGHDPASHRPGVRHDADVDSACAVAQGEHGADHSAGTLVAVYATRVAEALLRWARELGFATVLVEPDPDRAGAEHRHAADALAKHTADVRLDEDVDVVVTDHHRDDLVDQLEVVIHAPVRSIGLMGSPRHAPPHVEPLRARGVSDALIGKVQRPIGLDIGSKTPAEIALATLAGLVAQRNGRAGGFPARGLPPGARRGQRRSA